MGDDVLVSILIFVSLSVLLLLRSLLSLGMKKLLSLLMLRHALVCYDMSNLFLHNHSLRVLRLWYLDK